jgi:hypothetical protein
MAAGHARFRSRRAASVSPAAASSASDPGAGAATAYGVATKPNEFPEASLKLPTS